MYEKHWKELHRSVCSINLYGNSGGKVIGVSGFRLGNKIITDNWVYLLEDISQIKIRFYEEDGYSVFREIVFDTEAFKKILPEKEPFDKYGLTYLKLNDNSLEDIPELMICPDSNNVIGEESFFIGYQFKHNNLGIKSTIVSSFILNDKGLSYILYDGTVKPGSSGAPLLSKSSGKLIGIISNKELGILNTYQDIMRNSDLNIEMLESIKGKMVVDNIDIVQVMMASQNQLKHFAKEFYGNFAAKIGYALDAEHLKEMLDGDEDLDFE